MVSRYAGVHACGCPDYVYLSGCAKDLQGLVTEILISIDEGRTDVVGLSAEPVRDGSRMTPLAGLAAREEMGPVHVEVEGDTAVLIGGPEQLRQLLRHLSTRIEGGTGHHEVLRAIEEWYPFIDERTHIDLVVE